MATWFSGTSTDNKYEVGKSYIGSQGDRMTAQADGSFYNERTGRSSVGSSQDRSVQWSSDSASDRMPGFWTDQGRYVPGPTFGSAGVGYDTTPGGANTSGAGGAGAGASDVPGVGAAGGRTGGRGGGSGAGSSLVVSGTPGFVQGTGPGTKLKGGDTTRYLEIGDWPIFGPLTWAIPGDFVDAEVIEDIMGDDIGSWPFVITKFLHSTAVNVERMGDWSIPDPGQYPTRAAPGQTTWDGGFGRPSAW